MANNQSVLDEARISFIEFEKLKVSNYSNRPNQKSAYGSGLNADQTKNIFDAQGEYLARKHELLIDNLEPMALNEIDRKQSENARKEAERARSAAEGSIESQSGRAWAEKLRDDAENERKNIFASVEKMAGDLDAALDELHAYAQALIGGDGA